MLVILIISYFLADIEIPARNTIADFPMERRIVRGTSEHRHHIYTRWQDLPQKRHHLDNPEKEIEKGKWLIERLLFHVDDNVTSEWHQMRAENPTPKRTEWTDGWVLTLRLGSAERRMEFDNDELSELPAAREQQNQIIREIRHEIAGLGP